MESHQILALSALDDVAPQHFRPTPVSDPTANRAKLARQSFDMLTALCSALAKLHPGDLAHLFRHPMDGSVSVEPVVLVPNKAHALADAEKLRWALQCLRRHAWAQLSDVDRGGHSLAMHWPPPIRSAGAVGRAVEADRPRITAYCHDAGLTTPAAVAAVERTIQRVAAYINGWSRQIDGKERVRLFTPIRNKATRLQVLLPQLVALPIPPISNAGMVNPLGISGTVPVGLALALLARLVENVSELMASAPRRAPGRTETPDPLIFGIECVTAVWKAHQSQPATPSRNRDGFLGFGEAALMVAVDAQGTRPDWFHKTTIAFALRKYIHAEHAAYIKRHQACCQSVVPISESEGVGFRAV